MADVIEHRGPDDGGYFEDGVAFLGHRRLSIVDVAGGHQPLFNEDENLVIIYNGEIFNHASLRPELEAAGHRYHTRCDTEMIIHAYEQFGEKCVDRFRGMFAFVIWDRARRRLFAARDRLGIKPFYYHWDGQRLVFASEIKALLEYPGIGAALEKDLLPEYLSFGYVSGERTMFAGIRKLMPGHWLSLDLAGGGAPRIERYWDVPPRSAQTVEKYSDAEWIAETRRRLEETVRMRLMADVPLGMFLSGGVDSSAIAALIKRMADGPVKTFAVGYAEAQYSELGFAAELAREIGTDHHEVRVSREDFFGQLPKLVWHEDEPITWPSSVSLYFVARLAAGQVKVVLTGEGSDELFGGYERYFWTAKNMQLGRAWDLLPGFARRLVREQIASSPLLGDNLRRKLGHTFLGRENSIESLLLDNFYAAFSLGEQNRLLASPPERVYQSYRSYWNQREGAPLLERMLYADQKTYLVELLMKQDQMSMACSLESRVPFLDHTFVEFASRVPDHLKIHGGTQKYILKKAVENLIPLDTIQRRKMGFPTPLRQWFLDPASQPWFDLLEDPDGLVAAHLDMDAVRGLLERHRNRVEDATDRIWRLVNLQLWGAIFLGAASPARRQQFQAVRSEEPRIALS